MTLNFAKFCTRNIKLTRCFSSSILKLQQSKQNQEKSRIRSYVMESYLRYMNYYEQILEKRFPAAMKIYKVFSYGIKSFFRDVKSFVVVRLTVISLSESEGFRDLSRREIELYDQMPSDMLKITPVLLLSAIPFSNYVVFPLAYMYPNKLLTSHFWTEEQKEDFNFKDLQCRTEYGNSVFKCLNQYIPDIRERSLKSKWCSIMTEIHIGNQPTVEEIIECKSLFVTGPYCLRNLHIIHMRSLIYLHGLTLGFHPSRKLSQRSFILQEMDKAIVREGGVKKMSVKEISHACFIRGLHTCSLTEAEQSTLLSNWISISTATEEDSVSLILHGPVLLGYNIPCNFIKPKVKV